MPRFSANLSFLFQDLPFYERLDAAADNGFRGVEYMSPYDYEVGEIKRRLRANGLTQVLFNLPAGDFAKGERGFASDPARVAEFREGVEAAVDDRARARLHARELPGRHRDPAATIRAHARADAGRRISLRRAARSTRSARRWWSNRSTASRRRDFMIGTTAEALALIADVGAPNFKLQYDVLPRAALRRKHHRDDPRARREDRARADRRQPRPQRARNRRARVRTHPAGVRRSRIRRLGRLEYRPSRPVPDTFAWIDGYRKHRGSSTVMSEQQHKPVIGFIGLGIMGKPMAQQSPERGLSAHRAEPIARAPSTSWSRRARARGDAARRRRAAATSSSRCCPTRRTSKRSRSAPTASSHGIRRRRAVDRHEHDRAGDDAARRRAARGERRRRRSTRRSAAARKARSTRRSRSWSAAATRTFARAKPIFEALGKNIVHVGELGAGQVDESVQPDRRRRDDRSGRRSARARRSVGRRSRQSARRAAGRLRAEQDPRSARPADDRPHVQPGFQSEAAPQGHEHRRERRRRARPRSRPRQSSCANASTRSSRAATASATTARSSRSTKRRRRYAGSS